MAIGYDNYVRVMRRVGVLVGTVLVAVAIGHVFLVSSTGDESFSSAISSTPGYMRDVFVRFDLGDTAGRRCGKPDSLHPGGPLCASYSPDTVAHMLIDRVQVDVLLLAVGAFLGLLIGVAGGRFCATHPGTRRARALHVATAFQLAAPVFFQALLVIFYFSSNVSEFIRLPFISGQGEYVPVQQDPIQFLQSMWVPWLLIAFPLAALLLRITEASLRDDLQEDFIRTARAKGVPERRVINLHALPVAGPAIAAMTGVNVSTMLINVAVIEVVYGIPGLFRVINNAVHDPADIAVLQALVLEGVVLIVVANALVDLVQYLIDPRVRG
jgi:peptide/nickel transport system permease protein